MILPFALVILAIITVLIRTIGQVWVHHRVQMTLLERLEERPDLLEVMQEVQDVVEEPPRRPGNTFSPDFVLTGVVLAGIGIACAVIAGVFGRSQVATAVYFGGVLCVCLGFILAVVGLLVRYLHLSAIRRFKDDL
jgi:hypothetical protein